MVLDIEIMLMNISLKFQHSRIRYQSEVMDCDTEMFKGNNYQVLICVSVQTGYQTTETR